MAEAAWSISLANGFRDFFGMHKQYTACSVRARPEGGWQVTTVAKGGYLTALAQLCDAISERLVLTLEYRGSIGTRLVEPHAVGISGTGEETLLAWQLSGPSTSGSPVGWKNFRLSSIRTVHGTGAHFEVRPDYSPTALQFSKVLCHL